MIDSSKFAPQSEGSQSHEAVLYTVGREDHQSVPSHEPMAHQVACYQVGKSDDVIEGQSV